MGYKQAILDRICRPIQFEVYNGDMEWKDAKGVSVLADFTTKLTKAKSRERLRAAVSLDGQFPIRMITDAHARLMAIRSEQSSTDAGGMVLAMDIEHAEAIGEVLHSISGIKPIIVHNKIDDSQEKINLFRSGTSPWIVGIQMLSEGIDIPRLRVGVYCTNVKATLYFHQFCGRMTRVQSSDLERAFVFMPGEADLEATAKQIEEEVAHALGEDLPVREKIGSGFGSRQKRDIIVEDSDSKLNASIYSGNTIPEDYKRRHERAIREYKESIPSLRNMQQVELIILLVALGKLPPYAREAA